MCLSIPAKILKVIDKKAIVDFQGKKEQVDTQLIDNIKVGEYALISNGFIIKKIDFKEAKEILNIIGG